MKIEYKNTEVLIHLTEEEAVEIGQQHPTESIESSEVLEKIDLELFAKYFCTECEAWKDSEGHCTNTACSESPDYIPEQPERDYDDD